MNINKITIIGTILSILLILGIPTIYKVVKNHHHNLYLVVEEKIINSAKKCYFDEICNENKIFLKDLYELNYLEKVNNPVTKEYYNELSYVKIDNDEFKFVVEE